MGKVGLWGLAGLVAIGTAIYGVVAIFALAKPHAYGRVGIPGSAVLHLPAGRVDVSFRTFTSSNNGIVIPPMRLGIRGDGGNPTVTESHGAVVSINNDTRIRVWKLEVPRTGSYRATVDGRVGGYIAPELQFGHGSPAAHIFLYGFAAAAVLFVLALVVTIMSGRRKPPPAPATQSGEIFGR